MRGESRTAVEVGKHEGRGGGAARAGVACGAGRGDAVGVGAGCAARVHGAKLDRSTLADWVGASSHLMAPLVDAVRQHVMTAAKLHADDTPVPVLAPGQGKTKQARLWTYVRDDRPSASQRPLAVWFTYSPDRKGEHPKQHLSGFSGILQADGDAGFHHLYEGGLIREAACWAHVGRKFYDLQQAHASPVATEAIERIGSLYASKKKFVASLPNIDTLFGKREHGLCSMPSIFGSNNSFTACQQNRMWQRRSVMPWLDGGR